MTQTCTCAPLLPACAFCTAKGGGNSETPCRYMSLTVVRVHGSVREWRHCGHPAQPLGNPVCRCKGGCRPTCGGYELPPKN